MKSLRELDDELMKLYDRFPLAKSDERKYILTRSWEIRRELIKRKDERRKPIVNVYDVM